ncbi:hypothetical protein [Geminicoccus harenae]|uniref:hypothetical protein n=1 Tax=Geminicoccus harenae TaxID=2498453 RepID=UPI00168C0E7D|nr:hypothetical protein [Geminicoccus harenae]
MFDQLQQQTLAIRIAAAMAEQTAWMTTEREDRRRQLRRQPDQGWQEVATVVTEARQERAAAD